MTVLRLTLAVSWIGLLILSSGIQLAHSEVGVFPSASCFGSSTRIPGVEGAFAVVATDNIGGVYVAYQSQWTETNSSYIHVYFACSHDYGKSWSESFRVDDDGRSSVQCDSPTIAVDKNTGHVFVAWKDNRTGVAKVYVDKSVDGGVSFGSDVLVYNWHSDYVATWLPFTVNIEVGDAGKIYAAWIAYYSDSYTDCDIFFASSNDDGQTFNTPITVNPAEAGVRLTHPWIAVDAGNVLYVAYLKSNSTFSGVFLAKSLNGGESFEAAVKVNDDTTRRYRGGVQVVVSPDGKIHLVWTDSRAGDGTQYMDIYYATSSDGGLSFGPNVRVNDDLITVPPSMHQHFTRGAQGTPSIVADSESRVHVVWEDFRNFVDDTAYCRDTYYAYSVDGTQFSMNVKVNYVQPDVDSVNNADPNMAVDSQDNLFIVYSDAPSGDNNHPQIYFEFAPSSALKSTTMLVSIVSLLCLPLAVLSVSLALLISFYERKSQKMKIPRKPPLSQ
jgi:hypothetical protein